MDRGLAISWALVALLAVPGAARQTRLRESSNCSPLPSTCLHRQSRAPCSDGQTRRDDVDPDSFGGAARSADHPGSRESIADEGIVALSNKTSPESRRLNLPQEFFAEQTELSVAARALAAAAAADGGDDAALADRFSRIDADLRQLSQRVFAWSPRAAAAWSEGEIISGQAMESGTS